MVAAGTHSTPRQPATSTGSTATVGSIEAAPAGISKQPQHLTSCPSTNSLPPMEAADIMQKPCFVSFKYHVCII